MELKTELKSYPTLDIDISFGVHNYKCKICLENLFPMCYPVYYMGLDLTLCRVIQWMSHLWRSQVFTHLPCFFIRNKWTHVCMTEWGLDLSGNVTLTLKIHVEFFLLDVWTPCASTSHSFIWKEENVESVWLCWNNVQQTVGT